MSKRKRARKPPADETTDDASVKDDMVHVTPDVLAGSPDVFAEGKAAAEPAAEAPAAEAAPQPTQEEPAGTPEPAEPSTWPAPQPVPAPTEPAAMEPAPQPEPAPTPEPEPTPTEPASMEPASIVPAEPAPEKAPAEGSAAVPATTAAPPAPPIVSAAPYPAKSRRAGSTAALGVVLVVVGLFALLVVLTGVDLTQYGWPLFILIPGLTLLIAGFVTFGAAATIPGGIVTMLGLVLAYANSTGDWPIWAYGWALVVPGGVGLGMYLQALRDRDRSALRTGRTLLFISLMIFLIGFVVFESILGISGRDYFGPVGKGALPALLIIVGVVLLVRSIQGNRPARSS